MFNIEENESLLESGSPKEFLNLMETHFRTHNIDRYFYLFLPTESRLNNDVIEFHQYGYEKIPNVLQRILTFIHSEQGAKFVKNNASTLLKPFDENSEVWKLDVVQEHNVDIPDPDPNGRCLYIPVHAGASYSGLFYLRGLKQTAQFFNSPRKTQMMCQMLHQKYCELWPQPSSRAITFTDREREIINWMAQGKSNSVIGDIIGMSKHTVDAHLRIIFKKLNVSNRTAAAVKASELDLLQF